MTTQHVSVFLQEILTAFDAQPLKVVVDGTLGGAGHAKALLEEHPSIRRFIAIDKDFEAIERAKITLKPWLDVVEFHQCSFKEIDTLLQGEKADAILADLGISSDQLEDFRGISFKGDAPLDMRMDRNQDLTAAEIIATYSEKDLAYILEAYGEERRAKKLAKVIVARRKEKRIETTKELKVILAPFFPPKKGQRRSPLTQVFQALRIETNRELADLEDFLPKAVNCLSKRGRLAIITFHSLEDRIVKTHFKSYSKEEALILTKKPILPSQEELQINHRARSAKLRLLEKV